MRRPVFIIFFSNFEAVLQVVHILVEKLAMFLLALLPLLLKLVLLLGKRVFQQFRQSVCSVAASLGLGVWLLFTRFPTNFSAVIQLLLFVQGTLASYLNF